MEIRFVNPEDDRLKISLIYKKSWQYAYRGIIPKDYLASIPDDKWVSSVDQPEWNVALCVEKEAHAEKCVGVSSFCLSRFGQFPGYGEIISIYFLPEYMGKGYGRKLLDFVIQELKKQGYPKAFLWVLEENQRARKFYEKYGFKKMDVFLEDHIGGKDLRELAYVYEM